MEDLRKWIQKEVSELSKRLKKLEDKVSKIERYVYGKEVKVKPKKEDVVDKIVS